MQRRVLLCIALSALCVAAYAQHHPATPQPASLMQGFGDHIQHPVKTSSPEAQKFFDQGLRLLYGFNHDEAERAFRRAAELDPKMAMAWWGIAYAVGPNYNLPVDAEREKIAYDAVQKALALSQGGPESERAYIQALAKRYTNQPTEDYKPLAVTYREAMREVMKTYPDDLDAATLYAESIMDLNPWQLWRKDGTPNEGTEEAISVLESVMRRDPNHMGAVHFYIHSVEASPTPERALAGANRLAQLAPMSGHLVHMPAHIYIRTGYYDEATDTNVAAAKADEQYMQRTGVTTGIYPAMYYSHNLHFIAISGAMQGRYADAKAAAVRLSQSIAPHVKGMPMLQGFLAIPWAVDVRFKRWDDVLKAPQPDPALKTLTGWWHYSRGMAFASTGKLKDAEAEYQALSAIEAGTGPDEIYMPPFNNKTKDIMKIAANVLGAQIASVKRDNDTAARLLREAVQVQDGLNYGEPPDFYYPVRETLGGVLLAMNKPAEAEQVFRDDLAHNPRNPRSLFGLAESLKRQKKEYDARFVTGQFEAAWKGADSRLTVEDLTGTQPALKASR